MAPRRPLVQSGGDLRELSAADWLTRPGGWVDCSGMTTAAEVNAAAAAAAAGSTIWLGARPASAPLVCNETLIVRPFQRWLGAGGRQMLTVIQAGASLPAGAPLMAALGWTTSGNVADDPIHVSGIHFDLAGRTGRHGLVVFNFWSHFEDLQFAGVTGSTACCIRVTDRASDGSDSSNSHSENTFVRIRVNGTSGGAHGFWAESNNGLSNQDGHLVDSFFAGVTGYACYIGRAAGWTVENNHFYGTGENAIELGACYATKVIGNYVEDFGANNATTGPVSGYYTGINMTFLDGRGSVLANNSVSLLQPTPTWSGNRLVAIGLRAGSGQLDAAVVVSGNNVTHANPAASGATTQAFRVGEGGDSGRMLHVRWAGNGIHPRAEFTTPIDRHEPTTRVWSTDEPFARAYSGVTGTWTLDAYECTRRVTGTLTGDTTLAAPTNGSDGVEIQLVLWASGAQRILTFDAGLERLGGVLASYTIPSGRKARVSLRCSTVDGTTDWIVEAAGVTQ